MRGTPRTAVKDYYAQPAAYGGRNDQGYLTPSRYALRDGGREVVVTFSESPQAVYTVRRQHDGVHIDPTQESSAQFSQDVLRRGAEFAFKSISW